MNMFAEKKLKKRQSETNTFGDFNIKKSYKKEKYLKNVDEIEMYIYQNFNSNTEGILSYSLFPTIPIVSPIIPMVLKVVSILFQVY